MVNFSPKTESKLLFNLVFAFTGTHSIQFWFIIYFYTQISIGSGFAFDIIENKTESKLSLWEQNSIMFQLYLLEIKIFWNKKDAYLLISLS